MNQAKQPQNWSKMCPAWAKSTNTDIAMRWTWPCEMATLIPTEQHVLCEFSLYAFIISKKKKSQLWQFLPNHPFPPILYKQIEFLLLWSRLKSGKEWKGRKDNICLISAKKLIKKSSSEDVVLDTEGNTNRNMSALRRMAEACRLEMPRGYLVSALGFMGCWQN